MIQKRQGLVIWYDRRKNIKHIKRYGHLIYTSKALKYAILYVNEEDIEEVESKLKHLPFIKKVERSYKPFIRTKFENKAPDKAKQYDYNMGI